MSASSAAWPLEVALATAITADAGCQAVLDGDRVYNEGEVPRDAAPARYLTIGAASEEHPAVFRRTRSAGTVLLHCWGRNKQDVLAIYAALVPVLQGTTLAVTGHRQIKGRLQLITTMADPAGGLHAVVRYDTLTEAMA